MKLTLIKETKTPVDNHVAQPHASGFYRDVFKKFKGNFDRILMVGAAVEQIHQYAQAPIVKTLIKHTSLQLQIVQIHG